MSRKWKLITVSSWVILLAIIGLQQIVFQQKLEEVRGYGEGYTQGYVQGYVPAYIQAKDERNAQVKGGK